MQKSALESLAIYICKIYEASTRNELDSIPGIIESLHVTPLSDTLRPAFAAYGRKYGNHAEPLEAKSYLKGTFGLFCGMHSASLECLKEFRDKVGAHSDSTAKNRDLPSHSEFELLFAFAPDFRRLVARSLLRLAPPAVPRGAGPGLVELLKSMGWRPSGATLMTMPNPVLSPRSRDSVATHRPHGPLTADATAPAWNGYLLTVSYSRGVVFERWVTPERAD